GLRALGESDLPRVQRYLTVHSGVTAELFRSDLSSNAATFHTTGLKGRHREERIADDHVLKDASHPILEVANSELDRRQAPALNALNERLRDDFIQDSIAGVDAWNLALKKRGV